MPFSFTYNEYKSAIRKPTFIVNSLQCIFISNFKEDRSQGSVENMF